ncbi:GLPGLI family protein [Chryseobacterium sp. SL1]|uniref:GLPGLI family protein n=1 Tax=Chryseobacterium sp. SL1 TaxID=2995159 RepID=UPI0022754888|nr:GLPGLI family protein [Chryseobacterium sp. SL1]MCY1661025.1 GLPGLI family protein [Chryseobacterium sp. SL1]
MAIKNILTFFLLLIFGVVSSQSKTIIEYDYNFAHMQNMKSFVISDQKNSYSFFASDPSVNYKKLKETEFTSVNQYYVYNYDYANENIYQRVFIVPRQLKQPIPKVASEKLENLDWKITGQAKQILGYKAFLATTSFRGRDYTVWFTKELNAEIFPWKLKGLPGVILEFEDKDGFIKGIAKTISLNSQDEVPNKILSIFEKKSSEQVMPFKKLVQLENEVLQEDMNKSIAALPAGVEYEVPNIREMSLERSFEWQTDTKKP